jgi:acyl dehydratase
MAVPTVYRVRAHNAATDSENKIHDDAVAQRLGFRGGLVPGVTVYAYMTHPVVAAFGRAWLERGTMTSRFHQPFYEGDTVTVAAAAAAPAELEPATLELTATNDAGTVCATGRASLPTAPGSGGRLDPADYPEAPLPHDRAPATPEALATLDVLGSLEAGFHADRAHGFLGQLDEDLDVYGRDRLAHPGWLLLAANAILLANVRLGPWIHTASAVTNLGVVTSGDRVATRARVSGLSTRKGHELVELDVMLIANGDRPVTHIRHSAIYRLREAGPLT